MLRSLTKCSKGIVFKVDVRHKSWSVLFFGNDDFSIFSLKELHRLWSSKQLLNKLDVVTTVSSKPNAVQRFAEKNNLKIVQWPPNFNAVRMGYEIGIVVSFGYLIPKKIIDYFPLGMINVHASLLPRWRGASPIIHAILSGDVETGISIMRIKPHHFDTGDVIMQKSCSIDSDELMPSLHGKLAKLGAIGLIETLENLPDCINHSVPQSDCSASYAPRIKAELSQIKWSEQTSEQVYNLYRALHGFMVLRTSWHGHLVKLKDIRKTKNEDVKQLEPGRVQWLRSTKQILVHCKTGTVLIDGLTVGGKRLNSIDFYNGYLSKRPPEQWFFN